MGLYQFTGFLDQLPDLDHKLQVGFVVDATYSMQKSLGEVQQSAKKLAETLNFWPKTSRSHFWFSTTRAKGGDDRRIHGRIRWERQPDRRAPENCPVNGRALFPEPIDEASIPPCINLAGSRRRHRPHSAGFQRRTPYDSNFHEPKFNARRSVENDVLIRTAQARTFVSTLSSAQLRRAGLQGLVGQDREFMNEVASKTKGMLLDLSDPGMRERVAEACRPPE